MEGDHISQVIFLNDPLLESSPLHYTRLENSRIRKEAMNMIPIKEKKNKTKKP